MSSSRFSPAWTRGSTPVRCTMIATDQATRSRHRKLKTGEPGARWPPGHDHEAEPRGEHRRHAMRGELELEGQLGDPRAGHAGSTSTVRRRGPPGKAAAAPQSRRRWGAGGCAHDDTARDHSRDSLPAARCRASSAWHCRGWRIALRLVAPELPIAALAARDGAAAARRSALGGARPGDRPPCRAPRSRVPRAAPRARRGPGPHRLASTSSPRRTRRRTSTAGPGRAVPRRADPAARDDHRRVERQHRHALQLGARRRGAPATCGG